MNEVLDGCNLILSVKLEKSGKAAALAFSESCKVSTDAETGERITKESSSGKWSEKFVKKFSEQITADGMVIIDGGDTLPSYDILKKLMLDGKPVDASYSIREGSTREGKTAAGYSGSFIITKLDLDGPADGDAKYSVTLDSCGPVTTLGNGLSGEA